MSQVDPKLLMALMDTIPDRIYFKDLQGRFVAGNRALREFLRAPSDEALLGKSDFDFFLPNEAKATFADEQQIIATGEPLVGKVERKDMADGRIGWATATKVPVRDASGKIVGTCGISRDVTEEYAKTEQLKRYTLALAEKQAQMEEELMLARQVQQAMLPQFYPTYPPGSPPAQSAVQFAHHYLPEGSVGGDFLTALPVSDTQVGIFISDVMGHGVHAALVTAVERVLIEELHVLGGNPGAFLKELNVRLHHFFEPLPNAMYVTALYVVIDMVNGAVRFANAGHPEPIIISRTDQKARSLVVKQEQAPFALGVAANSVYATQEDRVAPGDLLFLYTDGLCDLGEAPELTCDDPRFHALLLEAAAQRGDKFLDAVLRRARQLLGQERFLDDVCLVAIEVNRLLDGKHAPAPQAPR